MRFSAQSWRTRVVGLSFGVAAGLAGVQAGAQTAPAQQNTVPDAPRPQTLPQLNTITPIAPATPNLPATPSSALPNTPSPQPNTNTAAAPPATPSAAPEVTGNAASDPNDNQPVVHHASDIRVVVNFHEVPFTVKDSKGVRVPGLTERDVRVYENGVQQSVRYFTADPNPLSVGLVIDQSMTFDNMQKVNASLTALQNAFTPYDEVAIYTYNNGVQERTGFTGAQSQRVAFALERSKSPGREPNMAMGGGLDQTTVKNNLPVDPNTNRNSPAGVIMQTPEREFHTLNDAILTAAVQVAKAGKGRRRVIYVISDGREYGSQAKEKEVIQFLQRNDISVYATLVGDSAVPGEGFLDKLHIPLEMRDNVLPRYAGATGGDYIGAFRPRAIETSFANLAAEVRTAYVAGYYSHEPFLDGRYRATIVDVMRPNLDVTAPKGYFPRAVDSAAPASGTRPGTPASGASPAVPSASGSPATP